MSYSNPQIGYAAGTDVVPTPPGPAPYTTGRGSPGGRQPVNLADPTYGLSLDGKSDDGGTLNQLMNFYQGRSFYLPDEASLFFSTPIIIPPVSELFIGAAASLLCGVIGGLDAIALDHAATLRGTNKGGSIGSGLASSGSQVQAVAGAVIGNLVAPVHKDGTQEYMYVADLALYGGSATSIANMLLVQTFIQTYFQGIVFRCNTKAVNALQIVNCGEIGFINCWFNSSNGDLIQIAQSGGSVSDIWFSKCAIEGWGSGFSGVIIGKNTQAAYNISVRDTHFERFANDATTTICINCQGSVSGHFENLNLACDGGSAANVEFVHISNTATNQGNVVNRLLCNRNDIAALVNDQRTGNIITSSSATIGMLDSYRQGGSGLTGDAPRSVAAPVAGNKTLVYGASIAPDASAGRWQGCQVTNGNAFTVNAPLNPPGAKEHQDIVIEILNSSGGAMGVITWNAAFKFNGFVWANPANGFRRYAKFEWNGAVWVCTSMSGADY